MIKLYGIANCDTVKKARNFLSDNKIEFEFVDFKKNSPTQEELKLWSKSFGGWPVNKAGRTYKQHQVVFEAADEQRKLKLLQEHTSLIKRPVLVRDGSVLAFGFRPDQYQELLEK